MGNLTEIAEKRSKLRPATIQELGAIAGEVAYVQDGPEVKYNCWGRPINVREIESPRSSSAKLMLNHLYSNPETNVEERIAAGNALGYSCPRVYVHEKLIMPVIKGKKIFLDYISNKLQDLLIKENQL